MRTIKLTHSVFFKTCIHVLLFCFFVNNFAWADITVVEGDARVEYVDPNRTNIYIGSERSILEHTSIDLNSNQSIYYYFDDPSFTSLNKILGDDPTRLLGSIFSDGNLIFVNIHGFNVEGTIESKSLILSTLDIDNQDFLNNDLFFEAVDGSQGSIFNAGDIVTEDYAVLLSNTHIGNTGMIKAAVGEVVLATGEAIRVNLTPSLSVDITKGQAAQNKLFSHAISSEGQLIAKDITLAHKDMHQLYAEAINVEGYVQATGLRKTPEGTFELYAPGNTVGLNTDILVDTLHVASSTTLKANDSHITLRGDWNNEGTFVADTSTVELNGNAIPDSELLDTVLDEERLKANDVYATDNDRILNQAGFKHTIKGNNSFYDFVNVQPKSTIYFEHGKTQEFMHLFQIKGDYQEHIKLLSTLDGSPFYFYAPSNDNIDVTYAWVQDAHNTNDDFDVYMTLSTNRGGSLNWDPLITWTRGAGTALWSTGGNWAGGASPGAGDDVVFDATSNTASTVDAGFAGSIGSLTLDNAYTNTITLARSLTITDDSGRTGSLTMNGGVLNHSDNSNAETFKLTLSVEGNFFLDSDASINVDGLGFDQDQGTGKPTAGSSDGGAYGGIGGDSTAGPTSATYGSFTAPTNIGSGGDSGSGGGAIQMTVLGSSTINGTMSANGAAAAAAGSGGSIYLTTGSIAGNGTLRANGGVSGASRGGGGGRISLVLTGAGQDFSGFSGAITTYGGDSSTAGDDGAAGTVYLEEEADAAGAGRLIIDNNNLSVSTGVTTAIPSGQTWDISDLVIQNLGLLEIGTGETVDLKINNITSDSDSSADTIWLNGGTLTLTGGALTIDDWTLLVNSAHSLTGNVTVASGGNITHSDNSTAETNKMILTINGNFDLQSGGTINVDGLGFDADNGTGAPTGGSSDGGAYGGIGGDNASGPTSTTYGSFTAPTNIGSGGDGGSGGGAIQLTVTGSSTINGTMSANGAAAANTGSGGSIYLTTASITGNGALNANGGALTSNRGGGGGRVAVILTGAGQDFSGYTGTATAYGGDSTSANRDGAAGTVYLEDEADAAGAGRLIIDNNNLSVTTGVTTAIPSGQTWDIYDLLIQNGGFLEIGTGETVDLKINNITSDADSNADSIWLNGGTLTLTSGALTIDDWSFIVDGTYSLTGNVTVASGGNVTHSDNSTAETKKMILTIDGNFDLQNGGTVNVDGFGYDADNGPGAPTNTSGDGGGYGGLGGDNTGGASSATYGSFTAPTNIGSGGDGNSGGGAIQLTVTGSSTINGAMSANATASGHGGSGGSIYLTTASIAGNGTLNANGGTSSSNRGGGGGRIAVILTGAGQDFSGFSGTIATYGGDSSAAGSDGAAGTVYLEDEADAAGQGRLIIDNNNLSVRNNVTTAIPAGQTWDIYDLVLQNAGLLEVGSGETLDLKLNNITSDADSITDGIWWNGGTFTLTSGALTIDDWTWLVDGTSSITGNITVASGGNIAHSDNSTAETNRLNLTINGNFDLQNGGTVNVDGLGYDADNGPGKPTNGSLDGAGHGGLGADNASGPTSATYGSFTAPTNIGSGGDTTSSSGGGAIQLTVTGSSTINGTMSANGASINNAGSGGSIYLTSASITGNGTMRANGGVLTSSLAGGGGRVAVILTGAGQDFSGFSGAITAYGGDSTTATNDGAAGTVYLEEEADAAGAGRLIIDNNNGSVETGVLTSIPSGQTWDIYDLLIQNGGLLEIGTGETLDLKVDGITSDADATTDGIWLNGGTFTLSAATLTIDDWTFIIDGTHSITGDLTIASGGNITHSDNSTAETNKLNLTINGNLNVQNGGTINVDGLGYDADNGTGTPTNGSNEGGAYGGLGGDIAVGPTSATYGSFTAPTNVGSGGDGSGSSGGGAIQLAVTGSSTINGTMSANGASVNNAGSGGSIYLTTGSITGNGTMRANGGILTSGTGGGGGRVAVLLTGVGQDFSGFSGAITAYGGDSSTAIRDGAAGTVYLEEEADAAGAGRLIIDNNNASVLSGVATAIPSGQTWDIYDLVLQNNGILEIGTGETLDLKVNNITSDSDTNTDMIWLNGGTLTLSAGAFTIDDWTWLVSTAYSVAGNLTVASGGNITHSDNSTAETNKLNLTINGNFDLQSGGTINVNGLGYDALQGPGSATGGDGGSYGGVGGDFNAAGTTASVTYGSVIAPTNIGSGGTQTAGGGAVQLTVTGSSTIDGNITANGTDGGLGEGSGGSIYLTTNSISGTGNMQTHGGNDATTRGGGGGGRIAVILTGAGQDFSGFSGTTTAYGGNSATTFPSAAAVDGAAGTVYRQTAAQGANGGDLIIANFTGASTTSNVVTDLNGAASTSLAVGALTLNTEGKFRIGADDTLTIGGTGTTLTLDAGTTFGNLGTLNLGGTTFVNNGTVDFSTAGNDVTYTGQSNDAAVALLAGTYDDLFFNNLGTTFNSSGLMTINGDLTITQGTLADNGNTIDLKGDFLNSGTLTATGDFVLSGTDQTLTGDTTFYNLSKTITGASRTLTFEQNSTFSITNSLTLTGEDGNLLLLRSSNPGTQWNIDATGASTFLLEYLDVMDSNAIQTLSCLTGCVDSLNNLNWIFFLVVDDEVVFPDEYFVEEEISSSYAFQNPDSFLEYLEQSSPRWGEFSLHIPTWPINLQMLLDYKQTYLVEEGYRRQLKEHMGKITIAKDATRQIS